MSRRVTSRLAWGGFVLVLLIAPAWAESARAQCVDSSAVNGFKVRSIKFKSLFGRTPAKLRRQLDAHRGEPYSADQALKYINEIVNYRVSDAAQQKYERLIANKLKLSLKGGKTDLQCVEKVSASECQAAFPGTTECVDVTIRRYFVEVDALNASPYLVPFPSSALAALYDAIPRPLLALNPDLDATQDRRFGPAAGVDTATDLLDLGKLFGKEKTIPSPTPTLTPAPAPTAPAPGATPGQVDIVITAPGGGGGSAETETPAEVEGSDTKLLLRLKGRKSLNKDFYDTSTGLVLERTKPLKRFQNISLEGKFDARHVPHGDGDFLTNAATLGFSTDLKLAGSPVKLINLGGKYRWSRNRFFGATAAVPGEISSENGFETRLVADGEAGGGLARTAFWFDGGTLNRDRGSYRRFAALFGYGKEFVIARKKEFRKITPPELGGQPCWTSYAKDPEKNEPTVGLELIAGAGHTWGDAPEYARFYAGAPPGQFLYDELNAQSLTDFPAGPLMRSFGRKEAGVRVAPGGPARGGASFWHTNVNVSIPVPGWSRPLIPHEWVSVSRQKAGDKADAEFDRHIAAGDNICRDLKSTVKTLVAESGQNLLISQQARDKLSESQKKDLRLINKADRTPEEQARLEAAQAAFLAAKDEVTPAVNDIFAREILPITNFIADHANIFAVKPLLMFDVAHLSLSGGPGGRTRYGAGGGLQLDVVLARFEFGYLAALNRAPGDASGHFVGRLVLRRLF